METIIELKRRQMVEGHHCYLCLDPGEAEYGVRWVPLGGVPERSEAG